MRQAPTSQQLGIGARIRMARQAARLTQAALGARLAPPVSHAAVSDLERGKSTYPAALLADLARILGVSLRYLYDGVRDDPPDQAAEERAKQAYAYALDQQRDCLERAIRNAAQGVFDDYMEQWPDRPYAGVTGEMDALGVALAAYDELEQGGGR